jgi:hypothetical protein
MSNRDNYENAVKCLNNNYDKVFPSNTIENSVSIYREDLGKFHDCLRLKLLFDREPIDFITIGRDSSIYFYSKSSGQFRSKQFILLFTKGSIQNLHLNTDLKLMSNIDTSWYQLERITSLAD